MEFLLVVGFWASQAGLAAAGVYVSLSSSRESAMHFG